MSSPSPTPPPAVPEPLPPAVPVPAPALTSDDRLWIVLAHLSVFLGVGLLVPLIIYLVKRPENPRVAAQAREALNFHLSVLLYTMVCVPLVFIIVGIPMLLILGVTSLILAIVAAVKSSDGEDYRYPLTIRLVS